MKPLMLALVLLLPLPVQAAPITLGVWSPMVTADNDNLPFWDGLSWDGDSLGVGHLISPVEYLHDGAGQAVAFTFDDPVLTPTLLYSITAWTNGTLGRNALGAFTYDSGTGRISDSLTAPGQYALFRSGSQYILGIEDILLSEAANDRDYQDYVVSFTSFHHSADPIPEPALVVLLGIAGFAWSRRRR